MSRLFIRYPNSLELWINGNDRESWEVIREGEVHALPPYGWLAIQSDEFYECSELRDGRRYDRVSSPDYVFVDGRGVFRSFDGIGTSGSVAVRRTKEENGLSVIAIEGVEEIIIAPPSRTLGPDDVRAQIARVAEAGRLSARAFDPGGEGLGIVPVSKTRAGWNLRAKEGALRYEIRVD